MDMVALAMGIMLGLCGVGAGIALIAGSAKVRRWPRPVRRSDASLRRRAM